MMVSAVVPGDMSAASSTGKRVCMKTCHGVALPVRSFVTTFYWGGRYACSAAGCYAGLSEVQVDALGEPL